MFSHDKDAHILADRKQRLLQEAARRRLLNHVRANPKRTQRGWLRLLADVSRIFL
jgi:hypothetical protein